MSNKNVAHAIGMALRGVTGVSVQVCVERQDGGLPGMDIVGLPAVHVKEMRHCVRSAMRAHGFDWPTDRLTATLTGASHGNPGSGLDLALVVALLVLEGHVSQADVQGFVFYGKVALDGAILPVPGTVCVATHVRNSSFACLVVAPEAHLEARAMCIDVMSPRTVGELVGWLNNPALSNRAQGYVETPPTHSTSVDFAVIRGQMQAKRACEIAAAGMHNILFVGPAGCGKTLMARALPSIMPPLHYRERCEISELHSISGLLRNNNGLTATPPFRSPHPTASSAALLGGGAGQLFPGEVSLAHCGVLFLDEADRFGAKKLSEVLAAQVQGDVSFPQKTGPDISFRAKSLLVFSANPCACGWQGSAAHACRCTPAQVRAYRARIPADVRAGVGLSCELKAVPAGMALADGGEASAVVQARVSKARMLAYWRNGNGVTNNLISDADLGRMCPVDADTMKYLERAAQALGVPVQLFGDVLRVSRTIADLAGAKNINVEHVAEALSFRRS